MEIKNLKTGDKAVNIVVQVREIGETREFDRQGSKNRMATAVVEDPGGSMDMPLFNDEVDIVKVGDVVRIINGYVGEFNGIRQLRAGKFGKIEVITPVEGQKDIASFLGPKKTEKRLK